MNILLTRSWVFPEATANTLSTIVRFIPIITLFNDFEHMFAFNFKQNTYLKQIGIERTSVCPYHNYGQLQVTLCYFFNKNHIIVINLQ